MHSRDYRVVRFVDNGRESFRLLPVAYDSEGNPLGLISDQVVLHHVSVDDLLHSMTHMMAAFSRPVLEYALFDTPPIEQSTQQALNLLGKKNV